MIGQCQSVDRCFRVIPLTNSNSELNLKVFSTYPVIWAVCQAVGGCSMHPVVGGHWCHVSRYTDSTSKRSLKVFSTYPVIWAVHQAVVRYFQGRQERRFTDSNSELNKNLSSTSQPFSIHGLKALFDSMNYRQILEDFSHTLFPVINSFFYSYFHCIFRTLLATQLV
jgi:hypothetical protein